MSEKFVTEEVLDAKIETLLVLNDAEDKRIDDLKDDITRSISGLSIVIAVVGVLLVGVQIAIAILMFKP